MADELTEGKPRKTVVDRYFARIYKTDVKGNVSEDQCVLQHSNKICVITLAPSHPLLKCEQITDVNYQVSAKVNRLENKVSGKGKKGAQHLQPESIICEVTCSTGAKYTLYSCVKGKLVEVNEELVSNPNLMLEKPETEGFLAVVLPKLTENILDGLLTKEEYEKLLEDRKELNEFELTFSRRRLYIGLFMTVVSIATLITWGLADKASQYMLFPTLVGAVSAIMAWENRGHRTCVLDGEQMEYKCVINEHSVETGKFHNVYIRLKAQKHGAGEMYYYVVFNGFHVTEQKITSYSKNDKKLRVLAKRLAENLNLNYFDVKANSKDHVIRHRPVVEVPSVHNSKVNVAQPV